MAGEPNCFGWAAHDANGVLVPFKFTRRPTGPDDVNLRITHCGMCHAELVWLFNKLGDSKYPMVPGHEVVGVVTEVGSNVTRFKEGDRVGVGTFVYSCRECEICKDGMQQICDQKVMTYNAYDRDGTLTAGGYSTHMVCNQDHVLAIPENLSMAEAAPLLCAGITVYSPMTRLGMNKAGQTLGVIGLGGLGHMAVKFGKAFGMKVTVMSTSESKREEALSVLGADTFVNTSDPAQLEAARNSIHNIMDTVPYEHALDLYLPLMKPRGHLVIVGFPHEHKFAPHNLILGFKSITGSVTGSIAEIQEMLDFCAKKNVTPMIEMVDIKDCNEALTRMLNKDVRYRFVIDIEKTLVNPT
ncbi:cinnamyl-alcohol dehydrogenase [Marchantia polymorpha subsp. ruderalis]